VHRLTIFLNQDNNEDEDGTGTSTGINFEFDVSSCYFEDEDASLNIVKDVPEAFVHILQTELVPDGE
jgi:hypothetical protein